MLNSGTITTGTVKESKTVRRQSEKSLNAEDRKRIQRILDETHEIAKNTTHWLTMEEVFDDLRKRLDEI